LDQLGEIVKVSAFPRANFVPLLLCCSFFAALSSLKIFNFYGVFYCLLVFHPAIFACFQQPEGLPEISRGLSEALHF
jgi:hypothetical protein